MDAGAVQRLAGIDIAEARDDALVEQQQLDRRGPPGQSALQLSRVEVERLRPERLERRPILKAARTHQVERTEPPGVVERDAAALVGLDDEVVVLRRPRSDQRATVPGHAEVEDERVAAVGVDQAVFRSPAEAR